MNTDNFTASALMLVYLLGDFPYIATPNTRIVYTRKDPSANLKHWQLSFAA